MMQVTSIESKVMAIVKQVLIHEPAGLDCTTHLVKTGALDSLGVLAISTALEAQFGIAFRELEINPGNFASVRAIADLTARKLDARVE